MLMVAQPARIERSAALDEKRRFPHGGGGRIVNFFQDEYRAFDSFSLRC
jgi:hypothetical protein